MSKSEAILLIDERWVDREYQGSRSPGYRGVTNTAKVVCEWHERDSGHGGAFRTCTEQPCEAVRRVDPL